MLNENIITERLELRNMTGEDAQDVYDIWGTKENAQYMNDPVESVEEFKTICQDTATREGYLLVVTDKATKEVLGTICAGPTDEAIEWGFGYSFKKTVWGRGYATETVKAIIDLGKSEGVKRFISDCAAENTGSAKVLEKCGMVFDSFSKFKQPNLDIEYVSHVYKMVVK